MTFFKKSTIVYSARARRFCLFKNKIITSINYRPPTPHARFQGKNKANKSRGHGIPIEKPKSFARKRVNSCRVFCEKKKTLCRHHHRRAKRTCQEKAPFLFENENDVLVRKRTSTAPSDSSVQAYFRWPSNKLFGSIENTVHRQLQCRSSLLKYQLKISISRVPIVSFLCFFHSVSRKTDLSSLIFSAHKRPTQ